LGGFGVRGRVGVEFHPHFHAKDFLRGHLEALGEPKEMKSVRQFPACGDLREIGAGESHFQCGRLRSISPRLHQSGDPASVAAASDPGAGPHSASGLVWK